MPTVLRFEELEKEKPETVILQLRGVFYNAFGKSALALSGVTEYQVKEETGTYKCGFPLKVSDKVEQKLRESKISYAFYEKDGL